VKPPEEQTCLTLIPFDRREAITLKEAATIAAKSPRTVNNWCVQHGIGRRIGGGVWMVSKVALAMFLDNDMLALAAYQAGDRSSAEVGRYFDRLNLTSLTV